MTEWVRMHDYGPNSASIFDGQQCRFESRRCNSDSHICHYMKAQDMTKVHRATIQKQKNCLTICFEEPKPYLSSVRQAKAFLLGQAEVHNTGGQFTKYGVVRGVPCPHVDFGLERERERRKNTLASSASSFEIEHYEILCSNAKQSSRGFVRVNTSHGFEQQTKVDGFAITSLRCVVPLCLVLQISMKLSGCPDKRVQTINEC